MSPPAFYFILASVYAQSARRSAILLLFWGWPWPFQRNWVADINIMHHDCIPLLAIHNLFHSRPTMTYVTRLRGIMERSSHRFQSESDAGNHRYRRRLISFVLVVIDINGLVPYGERSRLCASFLPFSSWRTVDVPKHPMFEQHVDRLQENIRKTQRNFMSSRVP